MLLCEKFWHPSWSPEGPELSGSHCPSLVVCRQHPLATPSIEKCCEMKIVVYRVHPEHFGNYFEQYHSPGNILTVPVSLIKLHYCLVQVSVSSLCR